MMDPSYSGPKIETRSSLEGAVSTPRGPDPRLAEDPFFYGYRWVRVKTARDVGFDDFEARAEPANVMLTSDDPGDPTLVKVLDFGIARSLGAAPEDRRGEQAPAPEADPGLSAYVKTEHGSVLGTACQGRVGTVSCSRRPKEYMSLAAVAGSPRACSGLIDVALPDSPPVSTRPWFPDPRSRQRRSPSARPRPSRQTSPTSRSENRYRRIMFSGIAEAATDL